MCQESEIPLAALPQSPLAQGSREKRYSPGAGLWRAYQPPPARSSSPDLEVYSGGEGEASQLEWQHMVEASYASVGGQGEIERAYSPHEGAQQAFSPQEGGQGSYSPQNSYQFTPEKGEYRPYSYSPVEDSYNQLEESYTPTGDSYNTIEGSYSPGDGSYSLSGDRYSPDPYIRDTRGASPAPEEIAEFLQRSSFSPTGSNPLRVFEGFTDSEALNQVGRVARNTRQYNGGEGEGEEGVGEVAETPREFEDPIFYPGKEPWQPPHRTPKRGAPTGQPYVGSNTPGYTPSPQSYRGSYTPTPSPYSPSPQPYVGSHTPGPSPNPSIPTDYSPISYSAGDYSEFSSSPTSGPSFSPSRPSWLGGGGGEVGPIEWASPVGASPVRASPVGKDRFYRPYGEDDFSPQDSPGEDPGQGNVLVNWLQEAPRGSSLGGKLRGSNIMWSTRVGQARQER